MCQKLTCGNQHRPWHIFVHILQSFPAGRASCCFFAVDLYTEFSTTRLRRVGWGCSIASQQNCNQDRTMTSVKTVHFKSEDWFGEMVLPKRGFKWFQGISSQSIPSRPEAIDFRVTAWLDNFSSVRGMYSCLWKQQQKHPEAFHILKRKNPWSTDRLKCTEPMGCLNLRLGFGGALQTTYPATQSKSNWLLWKPILGY